MRRVVASLAALALAGCTPTPAPSPSASPPAQSTGPSASPATASLAVYYTLSDRGTPKLVREFHRLAGAVDTPAGKTTAAVAEMLRPTAFDPDYKTLWPAGVRVLGSSVSGDEVTVDLTGVSGSGGLGAEAEGQAVQQLVWTATATSGASRVRVHVDGAAVETLFGHVSVKDPVRRAAALDTLHRVWVIAPQHGETVGQDVTVHLAGIVFENTLNYEILQNGKVVRHEVVTMDPGSPAMGEKTLTVRLSPGTYVVQAYEISMADSSRQHVDNHTFTVA
ncbi:MAG: hypothetical protein HOU81_09665 [Hamadaea sp.]|uniref:GerMN domain-containing protein n=1 Tax=Hamadaea sp. TaxID=2024425 RepID=UPI0017A8F0CC|nr:GerMN domain-containing protein [Hamadaea sp.]NUR71077.1 hypothetical protein [Hamadaea sp.]NUT22581.1 hypothetical protein [Hamadaea sp.]